MTAGGANLILLILLIAFISSPLLAAIAIFQMRERAKLSDRVRWSVTSALVPIVLILLAVGLNSIEVLMSNAVFGLSIVTLYFVSPFSSLMVLDLFKNRFPVKK